MKKSTFLFSFLFLLFFIPTAFGQTSKPLLVEGIQQYQSENYEEAIEILEKVRVQEPDSAMAAYFLGLAYKQTMDYNKAMVHLESALQLKPAVKEALVEYINILYRVNKSAEAKKWVEVGKKEKINPAGIAFLEGLILTKEKQYKKAIESFEEAKSADPKLAQMADYQIGLCYMYENQYKKARERFRATVAYDSTSDFAAFARHYQDVAEKGQFYNRPLRLTLGVFGGYDSNVISKPSEESMSTDSRDPATGLISPRLRVEYEPHFEGPWLFNAMYSYGQTLNQNYSHSRDSIANSVAVMPGYNFGRVSASLLCAYTNYLLKTDSDAVPDGNASYKRYIDYFTFGPIVKWMVGPANIIESFVGYDKKNFYNQFMASGNDNRDSEGLRTYLSWSWFYMENGFFNLRYDFNKEAADGYYWDCQTHRISASLIFPLLPDAAARKIGRLSVQLTGGVALAAYTHDQPYMDTDWSTKSDKRKDVIYTGAVSLGWEVFKNMNVILEYIRTQAGSNFPVYEYNRNVYLAGLELRF